MKRFIVVLTALVILVALVIGGQIAYAERTQRIVEEAARYIATQRNQCDIKKINLRTDRFELEVIVGLQPKVRPEIFNSPYDSVGMNVTFSDEVPGTNHKTGLVARNVTHKSDPHKTMHYQVQESPDGPLSSIMLTLVITNDQSEYQVLWVNTVNYAITGPFTKDSFGYKTVQVWCGSFTYNPATRELKVLS